MALTAADLREHLNGVPDTDAALDRFLVAALTHVQTQLGTDNDAPSEIVDLAVLMLAAHWYENREASVVGVSAQTVPLGYEAIISEYRNYTYG